METHEHNLEWLLNYDGRQHYFASGHFLKFEIRLVAQSDQVPDGIAYSFTFHDPDGTRLLGFDNAHPRMASQDNRGDSRAKTRRIVSRPPRSAKESYAP